MKRTTLFAIAAIAVLTVVAIVISSNGPAVIHSPGAAPDSSSSNPTTVPITSADSTGKASSLPKLGLTMPEFQGITQWWNTPGNQPLTPASLKGKVVLVDFWTYSCINCIRTFPFLRAMEEKYADKGLVIVGVHTPEFAFEGDATNVGREIAKNDLKYPVALDANYGTWTAYHNEYWPAEYLFDAQGELRHTHFGEGEYDQTEQAIRDLLAEAGNNVQDVQMANVATPDLSKINTPETYFGLERGDAFAGKVGADGVDQNFTIAPKIEANQWSVGGTWMFSQKTVQADSAGATFRFNVQANKLHLVMDSADHTDKTLEVYVDGKRVTDVTVNASTLYTVAEFADGGRHTVEIHVMQAGVRFYSATFS